MVVEHTVAHSQAASVCIASGDVLLSQHHLAAFLVQGLCSNAGVLLNLQSRLLSIHPVMLTSIAAAFTKMAAAQQAVGGLPQGKHALAACATYRQGSSTDEETRVCVPAE